MQIKIITTEDGSHSLFDEDLNETYHSTRGARGESLHVFIQEGLEHWSGQNKKKAVQVLEVGMGTGLNAFLTANWATENRKQIHFSTLEPFPIAKEFFERLNYANTIEEKDLLVRIHESQWESFVSVSPFFEFYKTAKRLESFTTSMTYDIIYYDAFAPSKQPEVWSLENLQKCYQLLNQGGVLTTYCAQGQFKRNLLQAGFVVETLQGAMGKKEMVRASR